MVTGEDNMSWNFTDVLCEPGNKCTFIHNISDLLSPESINISVVASNIFGPGPPTYYRGKQQFNFQWYILLVLSVLATFLPFRMQSRWSWYWSNSSHIQRTWNSLCSKWNSKLHRCDCWVGSCAGLWWGIQTDLWPQQDLLSYWAVEWGNTELWANVHNHKGSTWCVFI